MGRGVLHTISRVLSPSSFARRTEGRPDPWTLSYKCTLSARASFDAPPSCTRGGIDPRDRSVFSLPGSSARPPFARHAADPVPRSGLLPIFSRVRGPRPRSYPLKDTREYSLSPVNFSRDFKGKNGDLARFFQRRAIKENIQVHCLLFVERRARS